MYNYELEMETHDYIRDTCGLFFSNYPMERKSDGFPWTVHISICSTVRENDYKLPCGVVYASEDSGHVGNLDYRFHTHIYPIPSESSERVRQPPHLDLHMKTN